MGLLTETVRTLGGLKALNGPPQPAGGPRWWQPYALWGDRDYARDVGTGDSASLVTIVIAWKMRVFPEAPVTLALRTPDGPEQVDDHPFLSLLERPNPFYSGNQLWMANTLSLTVDGNSYWRKVRSGAGRPAELWYVPHWMMEPKWPDDGSAYVSHYEYSPGGAGGPYKLPPEDVVHFRFGLDPHNTRKGWSPLKQLLREVYTDEEAARFAASMLRNAGVPGIIVMPDDDEMAQPTREELEATQADLLARTTGSRRGEPLVMGQKVKLASFGFSPSEMDLSALRAIPESRIAAAWGIPSAVLGFLSGMEQTKVGATLSELREQAYESAIIPEQRVAADELRQQLLVDYVPDVMKYDVGWDYTQVRVLSEDENSRSDRLVRQVQGGVRLLSEARAELGLAVEPADDVFLRPINVMEVPRGGMADLAALQPPQRTVEVLPEGEPQARALPRPERRHAAPAGRKAGQLERQLLAAYRRDAQRVADAWAPELSAIFDGLGEQAADAYLAGKAARLRHVKQDAEDVVEVGAILNRLALEEATDALGATYLRYYTLTGELTYGSFASAFGIELGFNLADPGARRVVAEGGKRMGLVDLTADTRDALFRALHDARVAGHGPDKTARLIRQYVPEGRYVNAGVRYRSRMIARTETKFAQNISSLEAYRATPVVQGVIAFDNQTGYGDVDCTARDGVVMTFDEAEAASYNEHPNGTLSWSPAVPGVTM